MRFIGASLLLLGLLPGAASAATVTTESRCYGSRPSECRAESRFLAAPGEANRVTISPDAGGFVLLREDGAPLQAEGDCTKVGLDAARCPRAGLRVDTGDGDDVVHGVGVIALGPGADRFEAAADLEPEEAFMRVSGGDDDDLLLGGPFGDQLSGGAGTDRIVGGDGDDTLDGDAGGDEVQGGPGDDAISAIDVIAGPPQTDRLDGGTGSDTVSWLTAGSPVRVDLADPSPDGEVAARDLVSGMENVVGTRYADRLAGTAGANRLDGGYYGADLLLGRGGDDVLSAYDASVGALARGGRGDDRILMKDGAVDAGPGDDTITVGRSPDARARPRVACGAGRDTVIGARANARLSACDRFAFSFGGWTFRLSLHPRATRSGVAMDISCTGACNGRVVLRDGGQVVGRGRWALARRGRERVRIALSPRLRGRSRLPVRVALVVDHPYREQYTAPARARFSAVLRARRPLTRTFR